MSILQDAKYILFGDKKMENLPYEEKHGWINVRLIFLVEPKDAISKNRAIKPYIETIGWHWSKMSEPALESKLEAALEGWQHFEPIFTTNVGLARRSEGLIPLRFEGGEYGPQRLLREKSGINYVLNNVLTDIVCGERERKANASLEERLLIQDISIIDKGIPIENKEDILIFEISGPLVIRYLLVDRLDLERRDINLAKKLFGGTLEEDLRGIRRDNQAKKEYCERLERLFGFNLKKQSKKKKVIELWVGKEYLMGQQQ